MKDSFYKKMMLVAVPVIIQNVISIGVNLVDILMIGMLGEKELAAVGSANQVYFIFSMLCFGFYSGAAVYIAQYWGVQDIQNIKKVLGIDYVVGGILSITTMLVALLLAPQLICMFSRDPEVIAFGGDYLRMVCLSYVFTGISFAITYNSRAIQRLRATTTINAMALCVNVFLNYCFIYGNFGAPEMGVKGAALATAIARFIELVVLFAYVYSTPGHPFHAKFDELFRFGKKRCMTVMKTAVPVVFTEGGWAVATALTFMAYGFLGASALAVIQVAQVITDLSQTVYFGLGNATSVIIGESLGRGEKEAAFEHGKRAMKITWGLNILVTLLLILLRHPIADIYNFDPSTTELLVLVLVAWAFTTTPKMLAYVLICGVLRAGGDTIFCLKADLSCNVFIQVSVAFFSVLVLELPLYWVVLLVSTSDFVKTLVCYKRFFGKKWMNTVT